MNQKYFL